eukprot:scaffold33294_cov65-Phaeocystis_antarctica.AAC.2
MRASALFLSLGELLQASTAISKSCVYERLARRKRLMRREARACGALRVARDSWRQISPPRRHGGGAGRTGWMRYYMARLCLYRSDTV